MEVKIKMLALLLACQSFAVQFLGSHLMCMHCLVQAVDLMFLLQTVAR